MEKELKALMNDRLLTDGASFFDAALGEVKYIGGFQNIIYEYERSGTSYILRFTHSSHREIHQVQAELDWIDYLSSSGVSVSRPVASVHGRMLEVLQLKDSCFIVSSFEKAPGKKIFYPECMNNDLLSEACGELTGRIHALSQTYEPVGRLARRHHWNENYYIRHARKYIPADQHKVWANIERLMKEMQDLEQGEHYGLIHGDINVGNFFVDGSRITLFDFDECQYSWFVEDIAIQLFYMIYVVLDDSTPERHEQARRFMRFFLQGYEKHHSLDLASLKQMERFLRLREFIVYVGMHRSFDMTKLDDWTAAYLRESRRRLEEGIPIVSDLF